MEERQRPRSRLGYVFVMLFSVAALALGCFAAFAVFVKGPEEVLVPDVVGHTLEDALMLMQDKELYAKLTLRHSNDAEKGIVLEQDPSAGSIRKGYSRVSLVVSSGLVVDQVADYTGMTIDQVRLTLAAQFAGEAQPLIIIGQPIYKVDNSAVGTVLDQEPPAGTAISEPVTVRLVVSRGNSQDTISPPDMKGFSLEALLNTVSSLPLLFDYAARPPLEGEVPGTVVDMEGANTTVAQWSHIKVTLALPPAAEDGKRYGIFEADVARYPKPVKMRLAAVPPSAEDSIEPQAADEYTAGEYNETTIATFMHIGGHITVPYCVEPDSKLILYAEDTKISEQ